MAYLILDSEVDMLDDYDNETSTFSVSLRDKIQYRYVRVLSVNIPYSFYNIRAGYNDTLNIAEQKTNPLDLYYWNITIPPGNYTITSLVTYLNSVLNFARTDGGFTSNTYTIAFDGVTGKLTTTRATGSNNWRWEQSTFSGDADIRANSIVGLMAEEYLPAGYPDFLTSPFEHPYVADLQQVDTILVHGGDMIRRKVLNYMNKNLRTLDDVICVVPVVLTPFNYIAQQFDLNNSMVFEVNGSAGAISQINLSLTDKLNNVLHLNGKPWQLVLEFFN